QLDGLRQGADAVHFLPADPDRRGAQGLAGDAVLHARQVRLAQPLLHDHPGVDPRRDDDVRAAAGHRAGLGADPVTRRALLLGALLLAAGCGRGPSVGDVGPLPDFSLSERGGGTVSKADLRGKVWVASFVFTRCAGSCPQVAGTLSRLQRELPDRPDLLLVTFTVDPERDDPGELARYAERYHADPN